MDIDDFVTWWRVQERADIVAMIEVLQVEARTADGEVTRLRAGVEVRALLRRSGRVRLGCRAAHLAAQAVLEAGERTGVSVEDRSGVTGLARAAGDACCGLVAGADTAIGEELLAPFRPALPHVVTT